MADHDFFEGFQVATLKSVAIVMRHPQIADFAPYRVSIPGNDGWTAGVYASAVVDDFGNLIRV